MREEDWYRVNVITCAAPNLRLMPGNEMIILGAFGCGAFENDPEVVAKASKVVVEKYSKFFKTIEFAVFCSPKDERNYTIFNQIING